MGAGEKRFDEADVHGWGQGGASRLPVGHLPGLAKMPPGAQSAMVLWRWGRVSGWPRRM
jgi:hypothetical protein